MKTVNDPNYQISDNGPPRSCGEEHPRYNGVTCVRIGRCWGGMAHIGISHNPRKHPEDQRRFVYWGGASEEMDRYP